MTAMEVIQKIEEAWRDVSYPGDDKIFTPDSYDDEGIVEYFAGTSWRDHTPSDLRAHSSAFSFFTPEAYHFWLPAFMIAEITNPEEADVIGEYIAWSVSDDRGGKAWPLFSRAQREAVTAYLRFQIETFKDAAQDERKALGILEQRA